MRANITEKKNTLGIRVTERLKRFNEVYSLLYVVITILLTVETASFEKTDLGLTITFVLGSLAAWTLGHLVGAERNRQHIEIQFKLIAWLYASLVAGDVILKYALDIPNLTVYWSALCILISVSSGLGLSYYLRDGVHWRDRSEFYALSTMLVAALILYAIYAKVVVF